MTSRTYRDLVPSNGELRLAEINAEVVECFACPRLVEWRERVAIEKRASFRDEVYWGRPVPGWGDPDGRILVVGLAPAAHGGNRTGRIFTGDRSGDWLFASMHRCGLANQPHSVSMDDGLTLTDVYISAAVKCAPPDNKPTIEERDTCVSRYLVRELSAMENVEVIVCLGKFAWDIMAGIGKLKPRPKFGHLAEVTGVALPMSNKTLTLLASFHPSQQNTFTGKLTEPMLDAVWHRALELTS